MQIRQAVPQDFLEIAALDREAWTEGKNHEFIPDGEHIWRIWMEHAVVFCAEIDSRIAGAILAIPCVNGDYCIHKVFVKKEFRGKGLGSRLFEVLLKDIDEQNLRTFLTVDPDNKAAISLYEKWGFKERRFVKAFYRQAEDRYVLTRKPKNS